jgi:hypothetical protein
MAMPMPINADIATPTTGRDNPNTVIVLPSAPSMLVVVVIPVAAMLAAVSPVCNAVAPNPPIPFRLLNSRRVNSLCEVREGVMRAE